MSKVRIILSLLSVYFFLQIDLSAQTTYLAIRAHKTDGYVIYDYYGKQIIKLLPEEEPIIEVSRDPFTPPNFLVIKAPDNVIPIKGIDGFYLINTSGKVIKKFEEDLLHVAPAVNGYIRVFERISPQENSSFILYYDVSGNRAFGKGKYWEGSDVIDGRALVQIYQPQNPVYEQLGDWLLIDSTGTTLQNMTFDTGESLHQVAEQRSRDWKMSIKNNYSRYLYVNVKGEFADKRLPEIVDTSRAQVVADSLIKYADFSMQTAYRYAPKIYSDDKGFFIGNRKNPETNEFEKVVYDHHLKMLPLLYEGQLVEPVLFPSIRSVLTMLRLTNGEVIYPLFDLSTLKPLGLIEKDYGHIIDGYFIYYSEYIARWKTAYKVINEEGKVIYTPGIEEQVFTSVKEALPHASKVRKLSLSYVTPADLAGIEKLTQLEVLEIKYYQGDKLPEAKWTKLHTLYLYQNEKLTALPESFKSLPQLTSFVMLDSELITSIDSFISKWPNIKKIKTTVHIAPEVRKLYPNIKFEETLVEVKMK